MFEDADGVFSRSVAVVFVRLRPGGAGPTRVTLEAAAEAVVIGDESYLVASAKGRLMFP